MSNSPGDISAQLFTNAHTAYSFTDQPVSDTQMAELYELVKFAPTPMNSQALRVLFIRNEDAKARLLPHLAEANQPKSASAPVVAVLAYDTEFHEYLPVHAPSNAGAKESYSDPVKRIAAAKDIATLQAGYFILAVRSLGLDAGPMAGFSREGVDAEFLTDTTWKSLYVVNIGHAAPEGIRSRSPRLPAEDALIWR
jgi:3-hydroxypropanoate dehydrogenase